MTGTVAVERKGDIYEVPAASNPSAPFSESPTSLTSVLLAERATCLLSEDFLGRVFAEWFYSGDCFHCMTWPDPQSLELRSRRIMGGRLSDQRVQLIPGGWPTLGSVYFSPGGTYVGWLAPPGSKSMRVVAPVADVTRAQHHKIERDQNPFAFTWLTDNEWAQWTEERSGNQLFISCFDAATRRQTWAREITWPGSPTRAFSSWILGLNHRKELLLRSSWREKDRPVVCAVSREGKMRTFTVDVPREAAHDGMLWNQGRELLWYAIIDEEVYSEEAPRPRTRPFRRFRYWRTTSEGKRIGELTTLTIVQPNVSETLPPRIGIMPDLRPNRIAFLEDSRLWVSR